MTTMTTTTAPHLIGGTWELGTSRKPVHSPADGAVVGEVAWGTSDDANRAADAAEAAFEQWSRRPARERADILAQAADRILRDSDRLGAVLASETGKQLSEAVGEVRFSAQYFRWFAEESRRPQGLMHPAEQDDVTALTTTRPIGVAVTLSSWNFPCSIQARKLAAALAAGCTVVARVSEKAPLAATEMIRLIAGSGMPDGVVNLVHGPASQVTNALLDHRAVRAVSFTGSTRVGRLIMASAGQRIVRPLLELGGEAPFIVCADADLDAAVDGAMLAKFRNAGQSCIAADRFLVHDDVYDEFVARFSARIDEFTLSTDTAVTEPRLGPVIDAQRAGELDELVREALMSGARLHTAPHALPENGHYVAPALLTDVPHDARLAEEEIFGPIAVVERFADDDAAIIRANDSEYGLAAYVWTTNAARAQQYLRRLQSGIVGVNNPLPSVVYAPMGGMKQSGIGREGGREGLAEFQEIQYVSMLL